MTMSANPSRSPPSPWMTVARRFGTQRAASRAQFVFTTFGTTTSSGKAPAASAASNDCAVLPRPGSSARRNVRWPCDAAATSSAWCFISVVPDFECNDVGSGSGIVAAPPPAPYSNDLKSGPKSSQLARRRGCATGWSARAKSGARKGFAS